MDYLQREVYNFGGIRTELEASGHVFRSKTDTEVILHAYEEGAWSVLDRFIGCLLSHLGQTRP